MIHYRKKGIALLLTVCFLLTMVAPGFAAGTGATGNTLQDARDGIVGYYLNHKTTLDSWEEVVALREAGQDVARAPWILPDWGINQLDENSQPNDYVGIILGMLAAGQDPANTDGGNLVEKLAAMQKKDGSYSEWLNQNIWPIITLDKVGGSYDTAKAIEYLLAQQKMDGGFGLGDDSDPDFTGQALMALAPHTDIDGVAEAINRAKECLKNMQLDDGGFASWGAENPESAAAVTQGLLACGEDITADTWQKNGKTMIDALFAFQLEDGSFAHEIGGASDNIATQKSLLAVADMVTAGVSYNVITGKNYSVYSEAKVRVRVEGAVNTLADKTVTVTGTALDALKAAVGDANVGAPGGFIKSILGESGQDGVAEGTNTSWMYYVIRDGKIDTYAFNSGAGSFNVQDGSEVVFYIGAMDTNWKAKTFLPVVSIDPQSPKAGQEITLTIKTMKYDWSSQKIVDVSAEELKSIGEYTVAIGDKNYTTQNGQVTIPAGKAGTMYLIITNQNDVGYPDVVTYKGTIKVLATSEEGAVGPSADKNKQDGTAQQTDLPKTGGNTLPLYIAGAVFLFAGILLASRRNRIMPGRGNS